MGKLPASVTLWEMGARDGLQNEHAVISTGDKVRFIDLLSQTGLRWIEATSFVSPNAIPQLADAADVFARIAKAPGVRYPVLVPNVKGYERAQSRRRRQHRGLHRRLRAFHQAKHQHDDRRVHRRLRGRRARGQSRRRVRARLRLHGLRLAVRRRRLAPRGGGREFETARDRLRRALDRRHDRRRRTEPSGRARAAAGQEDSARPRRDALSRHARHRAGQRVRLAAERHRDLRRERRRPGRLPLRARRNRQRRHRRRALPAAFDGHPHRRGLGQSARRLALHRRRDRSRADLEGWKALEAADARATG